MCSKTLNPSLPFFSIFFFLKKKENNSLQQQQRLMSFETVWIQFRAKPRTFGGFGKKQKPKHQPNCFSLSLSILKLSTKHSISSTTFCLLVLARSNSALYSLPRLPTFRGGTLLPCLSSEMCQPGQEPGQGC